LLCERGGKGTAAIFRPILGLRYFLSFVAVVEVEELVEEAGVVVDEVLELPVELELLLFSDDEEEDEDDDFLLP
jgi:hypothetical protein